MRLGLGGAAIAALLAAIGYTELPTLASARPPAREVTLGIGQTYTKFVAPGTPVHITLGPAGLPPSSRVTLLGVGAHGTVLAQESVEATADDDRAGELTLARPAASGSVSYWVALATPEGGGTMRLYMDVPRGLQPGTSLEATVTNVPSGESAYLLGTYDAGSGAQGGSFADYVPPSLCMPNPSTTGMTVCNFPAPADLQQISFSAYTASGSFASLPMNDLPEVPLSALLPLVALLSLYLLRRGLR